MANDIGNLKIAWENLPEGMEDCIVLLKDGHEVAYVYKSKRDFEEVFCLEEQYPYVWWLTSEVAISFDAWDVSSY